MIGQQTGQSFQMERAPEVFESQFIPLMCQALEAVISTVSVTDNASEPGLDCARYRLGPKPEIEHLT